MTLLTIRLEAQGLLFCGVPDGHDGDEGRIDSRLCEAKNKSVGSNAGERGASWRRHKDDSPAKRDDGNKTPDREPLEQVSSRKLCYQVPKVEDCAYAVPGQFSRFAFSGHSTYRAKSNLGREDVSLPEVHRRWRN